MSSERTTVVDFIVEGESPDEWKMVLVEEGPWAGPVEENMRRIQERLYGTLDAALDGNLAEKFPQSSGKHIVIRLDCYNVPRTEVAFFFKSFAEGVLSLDDYKMALGKSEFVKGISFEVNFDSIN